MYELRTSAARAERERRRPGGRAPLWASTTGAAGSSAAPPEACIATMHVRAPRPAPAPTRPHACVEAAPPRAADDGARGHGARGQLCRRPRCRRPRCRRPRCTRPRCTRPRCTRMASRATVRTVSARAPACADVCGGEADATRGLGDQSAALERRIDPLDRVVDLRARHAERQPAHPSVTRDATPRAALRGLGVLREDARGCARMREDARRASRLYIASGLASPFSRGVLFGPARNMTK